jgi:hypothetical protein
MCTTPIMATPNFTKTFTVECDDSCQSRAFEKLKEAMCTTHVLATPDFTKPLLWSVMPQAMALVLF